MRQRFATPISQCQGTHKLSYSLHRPLKLSSSIPNHKIILKLGSWASGVIDFYHKRGRKQRFEFQIPTQSFVRRKKLRLGIFTNPNSGATPLAAACSWYLQLRWRRRRQFPPSATWWCVFTLMLICYGRIAWCVKHIDDFYFIETYDFRNQNQRVQILYTPTDWIRILFRSIPGSLDSIVKEAIQNTRSDARGQNAAINYAKKPGWYS
jgi:hypothetical protein